MVPLPIAMCGGAPLPIVPAIARYVPWIFTVPRHRHVTERVHGEPDVSPFPAARCDNLLR
jgi:hypothetical protein